MAKSVASDVLDAALAEVATATRLVLCSAEPANYAGIAAVALADVTLTAGILVGDYTLANGDVDGRKVTVSAQSDFAIDASGTVTHIVLDDGTDLQYVTTCTAQALTAGGTVSVGAWDIELGGNAFLSDPGTLTVADALHAQTADSPTLVAVSPSLVVQDATHGHTSDGITLDAGSAPTILFASQFADELVGSPSYDNGTWFSGYGFLTPSVYQRFTSSLDADLPGAYGYRIIGNNGDAFLANFQPSSGVEPSPPAVGESITWRWYHKMIQTVDANYHPMAFGGNTVSPTPATVLTYYGTGSYTLGFDFAAGEMTGGGELYNAPSGIMTVGNWYQYEIVITRLTTNTWTFHPRVFNAAGTMIAEPSDFLENFGNGPPSLASDIWTHSTPETMMQFTWGSNGLSNVSGTVEEDRWAAIACFEGEQLNVPYPQTGEAGWDE